jgi:hypothetical protein
MIVYVDYPCRQKTQLCHRNRLDSVPARNTLLIRNFLTPSTRAVTTKPAPPKGRGAITRAERPPSTQSGPRGGGASDRDDPLSQVFGASRNGPPT